MIFIGISSKLSGTCQSAYMAKETIDSQMIHIVDSETVSYAMALLVMEAVKLREKGLSAGEIVKIIEGLKKRLVLIAGVETLKYLKMGGRLSAASAALGEFLNIRPIISVVEGKVIAIAKARGRKAVFKQMLKEMEKDGVDKAYPFCFGHSNAPEILKECRDFFAPYVDEDNLIIENIGCVVGTHAGPGAVGIGYVKKL